MIGSSNISPNVARRILLDAKQNGVTVEDYLEKIAEQSIENGNKNFREIRRTESKVDLTEEREWLTKNKHKYIGQWVVLDGDRLVGAGDDPLPFVEKARREGVKIPFVEFVRDNSEPFTGGWL
jgi:hypothetical protein